MREGRRLAFDYGDVRIGVAQSDRSGILASPLVTVLAQSASLSKELREIIEESDPIYLVLGLPKNLSGAGSAKVESVRNFAQLLREVTDLPIYFVDERLTTVSAARSLKAAGRNTRDARLEIDMAAAVSILESALNSERLQGHPSQDQF